MSKKPRKYRIEVPDSEVFLALEKGEMKPVLEPWMNENIGSEYAVRHAILKRDALNLLKMNLALHDELVMAAERVKSALEQLDDLQPGDESWPLPHEAHNKEVIEGLMGWLELTLEKLEATETWADKQPLSKYLATEIGVLADD